MIFGSIGAAFGTAKAGIGIAGIGMYRPDLIMKASQCRINIIYTHSNERSSRSSPS